MTFSGLGASTTLLSLTLITSAIEGNLNVVPKNLIPSAGKITHNKAKEAKTTKINFNIVFACMD
jgi:hypothetical protein